MKYTISNYFAQTYGGCAYGATTYQDGSCSTTSTSTVGTTAPGSTGNNGLLTNTGFDILLIATLACVIIFAALVIRFWKRPAKLAKNQD